MGTGAELGTFQRWFFNAILLVVMSGVELRGALGTLDKKECVSRH
jgi:hypothetical protein